MKQYVILFFISFFGINSFSQDFIFDYDSTIKCGVNKEKQYELEKTHPFDYFYINKDLKGRYVVSTNNYQYPSFDEIHYRTIYNQIGGKTSSKLEKYGTIEKYFLYRNDGRTTETRVLMIDKSNMTFISRIEEYQPIMGICWYPEREKKS